MYRELQQLRTQTMQAYNFENPAPNPSPYTEDTENYMTLYKGTSSNPNEALLDSASTHTILTNPNFFQFHDNEGPWQHCTIITMVGSRNIRFREGRATVILPGGFPLNCKKAMYAPDAPRSLISYRDPRARNIHVSTAVENDEEVLELRQRLTILATARARDDGLYKIVINPLDNVNPISLIDEEEVCMAVWAGDPEAKCRNLAQGVSIDTKAKPDLWHERLGHPGTTVFRRMLPLLTGHNLVTADAGKTHDCIVVFKVNMRRNHLDGLYQRSYPLPCIDSMEMFAGPLTHHQKPSGTILL
jgi:hypothetical protein